MILHTGSSILLIFLFIIQGFALSATDLEDAYQLIQEELELYFSSVYNADDAPGIEAKLNSLLHSVDSAEISSDTRSFIYARVYMMSGKHFIDQDRQYYDPDVGKRYLEKAYSFIEPLLKTEPEAKHYALAAEIKGSLFVINPLRSIFSHGLAARRLSRKAQELDSEHLDVLILQANEALYAPRFYGGDPEKARDIFLKAYTVYNERIAEGKYADPVIEFTIYSGIGLAMQKMGYEKAAALWFSRSLEIYPENPYIQDKTSQ